MIRDWETFDLVPYQPKRYHSFPTVVRRPSGELLLCYRNALFDPEDKRKKRNGHGQDGDIWLMEGSASGELWSDPWPLVTHQQLGPGILEATISQDNLGWLHGIVTSWQGTGKIQGWFSQMMRSTDGGYTWEPGQPLVAPEQFILDGQFVMGFGHAIERHDGALLQPVFSQTRQWQWDMTSTALMVSYDRGSSWQFLSWLNYAPTCHKYLNETSLCQMPDGRLVAMTRWANGLQYLHHSESFDGGYTWSVPQQTDIRGEAPMLKMTRDGRLLMVYRGYIDSQRYAVALKMSEDQGQSWGPQINLDIYEGNHYDGGYADIVEISPDRFFVPYYFSHSKETHEPWIKACRFTLV